MTANSNPPEKEQNDWSVPARIAELVRSNEGLREEVERLRGERLELQQRVMELLTQSRTHQASRRAALNLLEDAVVAQHGAERESAERQRAEQDLLQSREQLHAELTDAKLLAAMSSELIIPSDDKAIFEKILETARTIMRSEFGSMQMFDLERGQLHLLTTRGFSAEACAQWEWVGPKNASACGQALRTGARVIVEDIEECEALAGTADLKAYREAGIRACVSTPLVSRDGRLLGMISTHWASTHAPSERELRLIDIVGRQAADLIERQQSLGSLQEANQRMNEFLAMLAHELRNPLAPLRNSLHILRMAGSDSGAGQGLHEVMERQVNHMVRLVEDLLEVSRITRGKIELRRDRVELAAVVRTAVEASKPSIEAAGHQLAISLPSSMVMLDADSVRLAQVLTNLLNNAAKYTDNGGQIQLAAKRSETEVAISVRDNGVGIPPEMLPRVFDMFTQVERSRNRAQGGLGIGLTLVRRLVELHGGRVEAKSEGIGRGSEFIVRLPVAADQRGTEHRSHFEENYSLRTVGPILIVDDNHDAANSLAVLLRHQGAEVSVVYDGEAALSALRSVRLTVALVDIGMPNMDGHELARRARELPGSENFTLIALTGWGKEEDRLRSKEAGFNHHLVKPVDFAELQALLASIPKGRPHGQPKSLDVAVR